MGTEEDQLKKGMKRKVKQALSGKVNKKKKLNNFFYLNNPIAVTHKFVKPSSLPHNNDKKSIMTTGEKVTIVSPTKTQHGSLVLDGVEGKYCCT